MVLANKTVIMQPQYIISTISNTNIHIKTTFMQPQDSGYQNPSEEHLRTQLQKIEHALPGPLAHGSLCFHADFLRVSLCAPAVHCCPWASAMDGNVDGMDDNADGNGLNRNAMACQCHVMACRDTTRQHDGLPWHARLAFPSMPWHQAYD